MYFLMLISLPCIVCAKKEEGFHLDLDDFLMGLLTMCNELVGWAVVTMIV